MNQITPIFIPSGNSEPEPPPTCPHCEEELPGWSEPSDMTVSEMVFVGFVVCVILANLIGALIGGFEGSMDYGSRCDRFFTKRYHYVIPTNPATCAALKWLRNKEVYSE